MACTVTLRRERCSPLMRTSFCLNMAPDDSIANTKKVNRMNVPAQPAIVRAPVTSTSTGATIVTGVAGVVGAGAVARSSSAAAFCHCPQYPVARRRARHRESHYPGDSRQFLTEFDGLVRQRKCRQADRRHQ